MYMEAHKIRCLHVLYEKFDAIICESMHVHGGRYQYVLMMTSFKQLAKTRKKRTWMALRVRASVDARD